jgi:hypothetical protein
MKKIDVLFLFFVFLYFILYSYNMGGRWDLGQQILIGFKCINTSLPLYSGTEIGIPLYNSSPYFPGVAFISYPFKFFTSNLLLIENLMLLVSKIFLFLFIYFFYKFYKIVNIETNFSFLSYLQIILFYILISDSLFVYILEFKGDIASFFFFFFNIYLVNKKNSKYYFLIFIITLISLILKQQTSILYFGLIISYLYNFYITKSKYYLSLSLLFIFSSLFFVFLISFSDSLIKHTIIALTSRENRIDIIPFFIETINNNKIILFFIIISIILYIKKYTYFSQISMLKNYFITIIFYILIQTKSAIVFGGNQGNIQVWLLLLLPFIIYIFEYNYQHKFIHFLHLCKYPITVFISFLCIKYILITNQTCLNQKNAKITLNKYKKIIIPGDLITISNSNNIISDFYSYIHYKVGYYKNDTLIDNQYKIALKNANYFVFNNEYIDKNIYNLITLNNSINLIKVDSAITRGYGKFYVYKINK